MSPVEHLQEKYREEAERIHRDPFRGGRPGDRTVLGWEDHLVYCWCGATLVPLSQKVFTRTTKCRHKSLSVKTRRGVR